MPAKKKIPATKKVWKQRMVTLLEKKPRKKKEDMFVFPDCPGCGDSDWSPMFDWTGKEKTTKISCPTCDYKGEAIDLFDETHVWMYAAPII